MATSLATKPIPEAPSGLNSGVAVVFYLFTFVTGGFFLFAGGRLGLVGDLAAVLLYFAVTFLFYGLNKRA